jgi:predicted O-methyltransferase YrrM
MLDWDGRGGFVLGDTRFRTSVFSGHRSSTEELIVSKSRPMLDNLARVVAELEPKRVFELGIFEGGSTALLAEMCKPVTFVAVDRLSAAEAPPALDAFIARRGLSKSVKPYWGIDQGDTETLRRILDDEFGSEPLDLVSDDASHLLTETRASFNVLFPRLRPGGVYMIEDWTWGHRELLRPANAETATLAVKYGWPRGAPLSILVFELVMAFASGYGLIDDMRLDDMTVHVTRGPAPIDHDEFDISTSYRPGGVTIHAEVAEPLR